MPRREGDQAEKSAISATAKVLGDNLDALMRSRSDLDSNPKLAKKAKIGTGTISRLRNGLVDANTTTLEKLARAFEVEVWQLLVPNMNPASMPTLQPLTEAEKKLYARIKEVAKEIKEES